MILTFLAGAGLDKVSASIKSLLGGQGATHKGATGSGHPAQGGPPGAPQPSGPPGQPPVPPQIAQGAGGAPPPQGGASGGMDPQMIQKILAMLGQMKGGQAGGG
jgi:hypothetical protein